MSDNVCKTLVVPAKSLPPTEPLEGRLFAGTTEKLSCNCAILSSQKGVQA